MIPAGWYVMVCSNWRRTRAQSELLVSQMHTASHRRNGMRAAEQPYSNILHDKLEGSNDATGIPQGCAEVADRQHSQEIRGELVA